MVIGVVQGQACEGLPFFFAACGFCHLECQL